ncbi:MAG: hypothetical protein LH606_02975 [Cytophagaceae bacterium]|nr:hypothetical protein [Cytophagaceae bacterium]
MRQYRAHRSRRTQRHHVARTHNLAVGKGVKRQRTTQAQGIVQPRTLTPEAHDVIRTDFRRIKPGGVRANLGQGKGTQKQAGQEEIARFHSWKNQSQVRHRYWIVFV